LPHAGNPIGKDVHLKNAARKLRPNQTCQAVSSC
jgi:hypothetical protein